MICGDDTLIASQEIEAYTMPIVVGITLRTAGKLYYFNPGTEKYLREERVLVETARGLEIGIIKLPPHEVSDEQIVPPLKGVLRRATAADLHRDALNRERETHALEVCKRLISKLTLPMRLIDAQYTFDSSHVLIHFLSENRVDFRELVRELAHELHTRIELRQVGVRDEAKLLGGYGLCGRHLCCATFLPNFAPVAINLAKEQGLALNPQKISGMCGRLMCCLTFEHECYKSIGAELPALNAIIETSQRHRKSDQAERAGAPGGSDHPRLTRSGLVFTRSTTRRRGQHSGARSRLYEMRGQKIELMPSSFPYSKNRMNTARVLPNMTMRPRSKILHRTRHAGDPDAAGNATPPPAARQKTGKAPRHHRRPHIPLAPRLLPWQVNSNHPHHRAAAVPARINPARRKRILLPCRCVSRSRPTEAVAPPR